MKRTGMLLAPILVGMVAAVVPASPAAAGGTCSVYGINPYMEDRMDVVWFGATSSCTKTQAVMQLVATGQKDSNGTWKDRPGSNAKTMANTKGFFVDGVTSCSGHGESVYRSKGDMSSQEQYAEGSSHFYNHRAIGYSGSVHMRCSSGMQAIDLPPI